MDGYISKPIDPQMLFAVVEQQGQPGSGASRAHTAGGTVKFDEGALLERVSGDHALMEEVLRLFREDVPTRLAAIRGAVESRDAQAIRATAHALKGAAGNLSAIGVFDAADALERVGAESRMDAAEGAWRVLAAEAAGFLDLLQARGARVEEAQGSCAY